MNQLMKTMFGILSEIKHTRFIEQTNQIALDNEAAASKSQERRKKGHSENGGGGYEYTEQDLKEHLKLTCSIIIDDVAEHWDGYQKKFQ